MNGETFMYTVKVALLGIGVVFVSLWALSMLMSVIKRLFDKDPEKKKRPLGGGRSVAAEGSGAAAGGAGAPTDGEAPLPSWVIPAAAAFLMEEELEASRSAEPWTKSRSGGYDPWLYWRRG